jgi:uncharacterized protein (TIGR00255 family)
MITSMTGFGHSKVEYNGKVIRVEIRSLNARSTEVRCKLPNLYRDREMDLRRYLIDELVRGKIECTINIEGSDITDGVYVNTEIFKQYYTQIQALANELNVEKGDILQTIMRIPNVIGQDESLADDSEWQVVNKAIAEAIISIKAFRLEEGNVLAEDLKSHIRNIVQLQSEIQSHEGGRIERIRERLRKSMDEYINNQQVDQNRFEQEIIYYLEKIDINEEKVRLAQHCQYFIDEMTSKEDQIGRKLGFIAQEIGREINTMGAKAQDTEIQQKVVIMKDELEKVKEQLANIL